MAITYVALGPNAWGKGLTEKIAIKNMKSNVPMYHGNGPIKYVVVKIDGEFLGVHGVHGSIEYRGTCEKVIESTFRRRT